MQMFKLVMSVVGTIRCGPTRQEKGWIKSSCDENRGVYRSGERGQESAD